MGLGCKKCIYENNGERRRLSTDQFIKRAIKIHGDKYNYEKTEYRTSGDLIKIYCNNHKIEFEQLPFSHLNGCGCYLCSRKRY